MCRGVLYTYVWMCEVNKTAVGYTWYESTYTCTEQILVEYKDVLGPNLKMYWCVAS